MSQPVHLEVFYPHPPERVWQVLTDRRALADWMMENDFEPKLGHKFRFYSHSLPGITTIIQCEVVELRKPTRLAYTWQESPTAEPSLVVWTLTTVEGGTQLRLKHHQYSYTTAVASQNRPSTGHQSELFCSKIPLTSRAAIPPFFNLPDEAPCNSLDPSLTDLSGAAIASRFFYFGIVEWTYFLNQRLPDVLNRPMELDIRARNCCV
jgi:uncharacterized protein YndB with AHSA1/START domain